MKVVTLPDNQLTGEWRYDKPHAKKRLIILCHGYQSSSKNATLIAITEGLNRDGYDTFAFSFSANTGGFDIEHQVNDIAQIIDYFKEYKELVLLASSFGALTAAIATIQFPEIKNLVTLNGFFGGWHLGKDYRQEYTKFRIAALVVQKYRKIWRYFRQRLRPELIKVPVLVIHSRADASVSIVQSRSFYSGLKVPKKFIELPSANHGVTSPKDREVVISHIDDWLRA